MPKRPKAPALHVVPAGAPRRKGRTRTADAAFWRALGNVARVQSWLDTLGRAQCTDLEVAAIAHVEGWAVDPNAPGIVGRLAVARLAGLAELRERMMAVAMGRADAEHGQAATAAWLSRQHLGHTPAGLDEATRRKVARLQGLPRHQLRRVLQQALDKLDGPAALQASFGGGSGTAPVAGGAVP